ncbi:hypothetical protein LNAOJCKE_4615 [Methylorubrum aminovorans]|uniref:Transposase n=1 Tax=Methylorubrum aminovorans TaxID=269069 RepID=A0ABQ4UJQ2_9HYPH|nr:hypothetical protein LNAOJCKE_4615 [Methylorubrum aminovorans]
MMPMPPCRTGSRARSSQREDDCHLQSALLVPDGLPVGHRPVAMGLATLMAIGQRPSAFGPRRWRALARVYGVNPQANTGRAGVWTTDVTGAWVRAGYRPTVAVQAGTGVSSAERTWPAGA